MESAVQRAVRWHPAIGEAVARLRQQSEAVNEARAGYMPRLNWGIDSSFDSNTGNQYRPMLNVSGAQTVYDFGKVDSRVRVETASLEGRHASILAAVDDLAQETAGALIEVQRTRALLAVARDQIKDARAIQSLVRTRTESGASTESDLLQAQARVQAAEAAAQQMESDLRRWQSIIAVVTGVQGTPEISSMRPSWLAKACSSGEPDWSRIPAIMVAEAAQKAAEAQEDVTRADALPSLELEGRVGTDVARLGSTDPEFRIGLNVTGSLYNGGASAARRQAAGHSATAAQAAIARARVDVQRSLLEASAQLSGMSGLSNTLQRSQATLRQTRQLYRNQYLELGTRTLLDVLNADQEYHSARFQTINIEHDTYKLNLDCVHRSGRIRQLFGLAGYQVQGVAL